MKEVSDKLEFAKNAVLIIIYNENCKVNGHNLHYWLKEIEKLQKEINMQKTI